MKPYGEAPEKVKRDGNFNSRCRISRQQGNGGSCLLVDGLLHNDRSRIVDSCS